MCKTKIIIRKYIMQQIHVGKEENNQKYFTVHRFVLGDRGLVKRQYWHPWTLSINIDNVRTSSVRLGCIKWEKERKNENMKMCM